MNIYLILSPPGTDWQTAVVVAETSEHAKAALLASCGPTKEEILRAAVELIGSAVAGSISGVVCYEHDWAE